MPVEYADPDLTVRDLSGWRRRMRAWLDRLRAGEMLPATCVHPMVAASHETHDATAARAWILDTCAEEGGDPAVCDLLRRVAAWSWAADEAMREALVEERERLEPARVRRLWVHSHNYATRDRRFAVASDGLRRGELRFLQHVWMLGCYLRDHDGRRWHFRGPAAAERLERAILRYESRIPLSYVWKAVRPHRAEPARGSLPD